MEEGLGFWRTKNGRVTKLKPSEPHQWTLTLTRKIPFTQKMTLINWDNTINCNKRNNNDRSSDFHYTLIVK